MTLPQYRIDPWEGDPPSQARVTVIVPLFPEDARMSPEELKTALLVAVSKMHECGFTAQHVTVEFES